jgi:hypothetical protein
VERIGIPAIREAEYFFIQRHDIENQSVAPPVAERCAFACVLLELEGAEPFGKDGIIGVGRISAITSTS